MFWTARKIQYLTYRRDAKHSTYVQSLNLPVKDSTALNIFHVYNITEHKSVP